MPDAPPGPARPAPDGVPALATPTAAVVATPPLHLDPLLPGLPTRTFHPGEPATVGRRVGSAVELRHAEVSRLHAELMDRGGTWFVVDQQSSGGTRIEEQAIEPGVPTPLADGDRLSFGPCPYIVRLGDDTRRTLQLSEASGAPLTRLDGTTRQSGTAAGPAGDLVRFARILRLLAGASDRTDLYSRTAAIALDATGHHRAAIVEAAGADARALVLALERDAAGRPSRIDPARAHGGRPYSRRLVEAALAGESVALAGTRQTAMDLQTVTDLGIEDAVCVPIRTGESVRACLYLDRRTDEHDPHTRSSDIAELLAAACGLALGNLVRGELEGRQRRMQVELEAAQRAQRGLLPASEGVLGPARWAMGMQPGLVVAGDLFDVVGIDADRTAVLTGDVAGHGIGPGIQMAMTQAVLRCELERTGDVSEAVRRAHAMAIRSFDGGQYVTLWAGILDRAGAVSYVNAGHGHVRIRRADGGIVRPPLAVDLPVGCDFDQRFTAGSLSLEPDEQLILFSDGVVDQRAIGGHRYREERLDAALAAAPREPTALVAHVMSELDEFRGVTARTDDTTIAVIERA